MMTTISANDVGRKKKKRIKKQKPFGSGVSSLCRTPLSFLFLLSHHPLHTHTIFLSFSLFTHLSAICNLLEGASRICEKKKIWKNGMNGKQISTKSYCVERKSMHHRQLARTHSAAVDRYYLPTDRYSFLAQCFVLFSFVLVYFCLLVFPFCFCTLFRFGFLSASFFFVFRVHICGRQNAKSSLTGHICIQPHISTSLFSSLVYNRIAWMLLIFATDVQVMFV